MKKRKPEAVEQPAAQPLPAAPAPTVLAAPPSAAHPAAPAPTDAPVAPPAVRRPASRKPAKERAARELIDRKANLRYFVGGKSLAKLTCMAGGFLVAAVGAILAFAVHGVGKWVGLGMLGAGGIVLLVALVCLIAAAVRTPSDAQIDAVYRKLTDSAVGAALEKAGLPDASRLDTPPVVLGSCLYEDITSKYLMRTGRDGVARSSNFAVFVLLFDPERIYIYRNAYSIVRQEWQETLSEYYYRDIVAFSTSVNVFSEHDRPVRRESIRIELISGTEIDLPLDGTQASADAVSFIRAARQAHKLRGGEPISRSVGQS